MKLMLGGINGNYLREITENGVQDTEYVKAAVAYATKEDLLFDWCYDHSIPLNFWGRFDEGVPITPRILKKFLDRGTPNFTCRLVRNFHPKVIWWQGMGAYIGSANLTDAAWNNNVEAGCYFTEAELAASGFDLQLQDFFQTIDKNASPLTRELYDLIEARQRVVNQHRQQDEKSARKFQGTDLVTKWEGVVRVSSRNRSEQRRDAFLKEWYETLETLRNIGVRVSDDKFRPSWVGSHVPPGAQADQFLHAHYYQRTFEGRHARYEGFYDQNRGNPEAALTEAMAWWHELDAPPASEDVMLNEWAPELSDWLARNALLDTSEDGFVNICLRIHAIRDHARRVANLTVGLPDTGEQYSIDEKTTAFGKYLYGLRSAQGKSVLETIDHVLYGGPTEKVPDRMWEALESPEWRIEHFGVSALGELVGWALPNDFPPRNGRTSKSLRSLGFPVQVHSV